MKAISRAGHEGLLGRRHGPEPVHAVELPELRGRLGYGRPPGHLDRQGRRLRLGRQLPDRAWAGARDCPGAARCTCLPASTPGPAGNRSTRPALRLARPWASALSGPPPRCRGERAGLAGPAGRARRSGLSGLRQLPDILKWNRSDYFAMSVVHPCRCDSQPVRSKGHNIWRALLRDRAHHFVGHCAPFACSRCCWCWPPAPRPNCSHPRQDMSSRHRRRAATKSATPIRSTASGIIRPRIPITTRPASRPGMAMPFDGSRTANGEIYDMNVLTAAHKTLPMPVFVRVTNLQNGRSLVLKRQRPRPLRRRPDHRRFAPRRPASRLREGGHGARSGSRSSIPLPASPTRARTPMRRLTPRRLSATSR